MLPLKMETLNGSKNMVCSFQIKNIQLLGMVTAPSGLMLQIRKADATFLASLTDGAGNMTSLVIDT